MKTIEIYLKLGKDRVSNPSLVIDRVRFKNKPKKNTLTFNQG
jgi:hypothetical protein